MAETYATAAQYRAALQKSDTAHDADIQTDLEAVSRVIDRKLGYQSTGFGKSDTATERSYMVSAYLNDRYVLPIDPLAEAPTAVTLDGVALDLDDLWTLPPNHDQGPEPVPITALRRTGDAFWPKRSIVVVTGLWGWPSVPLSIQRACIHLTAVLRLETPRATRQIQEFDQAVEASRAAQDILRELTARYKRSTVRVL